MLQIHHWKIDTTKKDKPKAYQNMIFNFKVSKQENISLKSNPTHYPSSSLDRMNLSYVLN